MNIYALPGKPHYTLAAKPDLRARLDALEKMLGKLAPELRAARKRAAESEAELEQMQQARANAALSVSNVYRNYSLSQSGR